MNSLTEYLHELRIAKKDGQWSREERRAVKAEAKDLMKSLKGDLKSLRRRSRRCCGR